MLVSFAVDLHASAGVPGLLKVVAAIHSRHLGLCNLSWRDEPGVPATALLIMRIDGDRVETVRQWLLRCVDVASVDLTDARSSVQETRSGL
ncbi:hypothetical protein, partial [Nocardioides jensenii]|uniref:hypothetical protein n=1 Tax=Nocardioides jensenii TaxID=1843 RepID=UPI001C3F4CAF